MKSKFQTLIEEAYKNTRLVTESHMTPYNGSVENLIWVADLEAQVGRLTQEIENGNNVVLKHAAFREDLQEMGMKVEDAQTYLFDRGTYFTQPVFVVVK
jgi:hypothetical protein